MAEVSESNESTPSNVAKVRQPVFVLTYEQKNITSDISPYVCSIGYMDNLTGKSDELDVQLEDVDGRWIDYWYPGKGDTLSLKIGYEGSPLLPCGTFEIDEIEFSMPPTTVSIRGLATGIKKTVRTRSGKAYENTTLAAIAQRIAKRNKLTLVGTIGNIPIDRASQYQEQDVEFLTRLGKEYGYAFKIVGSQLVFTELKALRDKDSILKLEITDLTSIRVKDKIKAVYQQAKVQYHSPSNKKTISCSAKDSQVAEAEKLPEGSSNGQPTSNDTLKICARAGSKATAQIKAQAALENANLEQTTGSITLPGNTRLVAGINFQLEGYGRFSGKYMAESSRHRIDRSGYVTELEIKRIVPPKPKAKKKAAQPKEAPKETGKEAAK